MFLVHLFVLFFVQRTSTEEILSISARLGSAVIFPIESHDESKPRSIEWRRNETTLKFDVDRYRWINRTSLMIERTIVGDEGFYTLKIDASTKTIRFHLLLFADDLSLSLPSNGHRTFHVEESINLTCSIHFYADRTYTEAFDEVSLRSRWSMIIHNNRADRYELLAVSPSKFRLIGSLLHYEIDRSDHRENVTCTLFGHRPQPLIIAQTTSIRSFNVKYEVSLRGEYFFVRSFPSHSAIEINCEEFDGNPPPLYTLVWNLNGINRTLFNKTKRGKFFIADATWRHRGIYTCSAENELNRQPAHQTFRLNIWFDQHRTEELPPLLPVALLPHSPSSSSASRWFVVGFLSLSFVLFILSLYCFCVQYHRETK